MNRSSFVRTVAHASLLAALAPLSAPLFAQAFPQGPVTLVCPYGPGTGIDVIARIIGQKLGESWGYAVVVKNQPGGSGNIGAMAAANSKADGSTMLIVANSHFINQNVSRNVVNLSKAFDPVAPAGTVPYVVTVTSSLPVNSLSELVAYAKSKPGEVNYSGIFGSVPHLLGVALKTAGNIDIRFISYKSTTDATVDAISGRVPIWFTTLASALPLIQSGQIRPLAVTGDKRAPRLPAVPTVAEAGFPTLDLGAAFFFMAPAGTPGSIIDKMNRDITSAMNNKEVIDRLAEQGAQPTTSSPAALGELMKNESAKWSEVVKLSGISVE
ncbi:tripartite tricarboxylate transporter substrate binding protein [soil metagenome]